MSKANERDPSPEELFAQGYEEASADALLEAVQRYLSAGTLRDAISIVSEACETRALVDETSDRDATKWKAAAEALDDFADADEITSAP